MYFDFIVDKIKTHLDNDAIIYENKIYSYGFLFERIVFWKEEVKKHIKKGSVVVLNSDYNPDSIALLIALIENDNIIVPLRSDSKNIQKKIDLSEAEYIIEKGKTEFEISKNKVVSDHDLFNKLRKAQKPGIIIFTSGSTGEPKAAVHDFTLLLKNFLKGKPSFRTISFLLFDHIGGLNTLLYLLSNNGLIAIPEKKTPEYICSFIERYKIELLPVTPSFLNILLYSRAYEKYDLSSLKIISYGTEPVYESTLKTLMGLFPKIKFKQLYGLTETGIIECKSKDSDSRWIKIGGENCKTKIKENILFIKNNSTILGFLNAESLIDDEGWYNTNDRVEQDGDWIKIIGRDSEIINVGGQKVFPVEIESVLLEMENVIDVSVSAYKNPILGEVVKAIVILKEKESISELKKRIQKYCLSKIDSYKIPVYVEIVSDKLFTERFKRIRK